MKRILAITVSCFISAGAMAQAGRIRISFVGFDCYRETWDDILQSDGKGDEVYFNFGFSLADKNGALKQVPYEKRTEVYGDATGPFSNRISAGSCVDLFGGAKGGIKAGDKYRAPAGYILGEYDMADGDVLAIVPTAWEYDPIADNLSSFTSTMNSTYSRISKDFVGVAVGINLLTANLPALLHWATEFGVTKTRPAGDMGELGRAGTRPIGMEKYGDFNPQLVTVPTGLLQTLCNSNFGNGNGVIAVNYDENALGNSRDHGNYSILLKVEFTPNRTAAAPAPAPAPTGNTTATGTTPAGNLPVANNSVVSVRTVPIKANLSNLPTIVKLNGKWAGTQTGDGGYAPQNVAYEFNDAGEIMIKNSVTGAIAAKGAYNIVNNVFSGTIKQFSDSQVYAFKGSYDPATQKLNFTMGMDPSTTGQGRIEVSKQ